jgi:glutathione S-transferase
MIKLYYYPNNASLAPHFLLHQMEVEHELLLVDRASNFQRSDEYLTLNPTGRIPTLVDGELVLFESPAICMYLCEQHPESGMMPEAGSVERGTFYQWLAFLNNTLQAELMVYYYPHRHTMNQATIPDVVAAQELRIADALTILDNHLAGKQYLLGDDISACDFFLFMLAEWSMKITPSPLSFAHLGTYLKHMAKHPTVVAVCDKEGIDLTIFK